MNLPCLFFGILFSVSGILFAAGKLHPYLSAWNQMRPEEQAKIRIIPLCRNIGGVILLSGLLFLFNGLLPDFQKHGFSVAMIAWLILAGLDLGFISKSSRYKNP